MAQSNEEGGTRNLGQPPLEEDSFRKECDHYSRGCSFVSPCCAKVYPCRLCHNDQDLSHQIDRHAITDVVCRKCSERQPVTGTCRKCGLSFGRYFCEVCRLYDDADKGQFHCEKCGLCRVGGRENYHHCDMCGLCLAVAMRDLHTCRNQISKNNCPVCMEDIHTSTTPAHIPRCGHLLHMPCFKELMSNGLYQCPQCQTSLADMSSEWQRLDAEKDKWQLPQHLKDFLVEVNCRDCQHKTMTDFHIIGLKCTDCGSYNTVRCGKEELPEDSSPGLLGQFLRQMGAVAERRGGRRRSRGQREETNESDSESDLEDDDENESDSDHGPDQDEGDGDAGDIGGHNNHHSDTEDRGRDPNHQQYNCDNRPSRQVVDEGVVDSNSYDGDESDKGLSSDDDMFYECVTHWTQQSSPAHRHSSNGRTYFDQPIEVPVDGEPGSLEWWESDGEDNVGDCHGNSSTQFPHGPFNPKFGRVQVMEVWGSDFFTDTFSEMSSDSSGSWRTEEEESVIAGKPYSSKTRHRRAVKKNPIKISKDFLRSRGLAGSHSEPFSAPGLSRYNCTTLTHTNHNDLSSLTAERGSLVPSVSLTADTTYATPNIAKTEIRDCNSSLTRVRLSSEDSWVTANEDWQL